MYFLRGTYTFVEYAKIYGKIIKDNEKMVTSSGKKD